MTDLPSALKQLSPIDWADVPQDDPTQMLSDCFAAGELLLNSVPPPNGTPFETAKPVFTQPNSAKSAAEIQPSTARPASISSEHEELRKKWGKPVKFNKKDNPLDTALYKMAGFDRNGSWFARYNVIEGIGFNKFKRAMQREFPETLLEQGPPGAGAKRGLAADRRVERVVRDVGKMEVYQLSAQMPSPVSPREFATLSMSTENGLSEKSAAEIPGAEKYVPRSFMLVSRPLDHPDTPSRPNFVKGKYESVEMVREIPLHASKKSRPNDDLPDDPELNPVEWIMITRSDPGGGIPRFLVDRGTPEAMLGDLTKFLDWACPQDTIPDADADEDKQHETSAQNAEQIQRESVVEPPAAKKGAGEAAATTAVPSAQSNEAAESQGGIMSSITSTAAAYTPASVSNFMDNKQPAADGSADQDSSDSSDDDSSSVASFASAEEMRRASTAPENPPATSTENLSIRSSTSNLSGQVNDKDVSKLQQQREKLDQKLAKKRMQEQERFKQSEQKEEFDRDKAREKMEKEVRKQEERHKKEMEKLEAKREKELKKAEQRRSKRQESSKLSLVARERDEARSQLELMKRENGLLSESVEQLQRENNALAGKLGRVGGAEMLKQVQDEVAANGGRSRSKTHRSNNSNGSRLSLDSGEKKEG